MELGQWHGWVGGRFPSCFPVRFMSIFVDKRSLPSGKEALVRCGEMRVDVEGRVAVLIMAKMALAATLAAWWRSWCSCAPARCPSMLRR